MKIYLSPSTQENNIGVAGYGTEEAVMNRITDIVEAQLKRFGYTVYRNKPTMTLRQLVADSNSKKPDIHFAIHSNAGSGKARGCEVYCYRYGGEGEKFARAVYEEVSKITPTADRGVRESHSHFGPGKPLYETAKTKAPAALIEIAFHDNAYDAKWIQDNIEPIAAALVTGINNYFGVSNDLDKHYKEIIQSHVGFSHPEGVWELMDKHKYAHDLYQKWEESYEVSK